MATKSDADTAEEFDELVNMTPKELSAFLETEESQSVGQKSGDGDESVGHEMGRHVVAILEKRKGDRDADDEQRMHKVVGYIKRHLAQGGPDEDVEHSKWRLSLMNWGHDPLK